MKCVLVALLLTSVTNAFIGQRPVGWIGPLLYTSDSKAKRGVSSSLASENDRSVVTNDAPRRDARNNFNSNNDQRNRPRRGGGGRNTGGPQRPAMKLENPLKLQKIAFEPPPRDRQNVSHRPRRSPAASASTKPKQGPVASVGAADDGSGSPDGPKRQKSFADNSGGAAVKTDKRPRRQPGGKTKREDDERGPRRPALRVGTGKKGRAAQGNLRRGSLKKRDRSAEKELKAEKALERRTVQLPDGPIPVSQLAEIIDEKPVSVIKFLMTDLGVMASMTQTLDPNTCIAVAEGFGKIVVGADEEEEEEYDDDESAIEIGYALDDEDPENLLPRPPVVTVMGHVDHGKTSLLDYLQNTRVTAGEAGGITQHIAAYQLEHKGNKITFIDTPGHAAFTDMRQRGANITDIVILVVAADDGVKQQTADSIVCARQAGVPIVVAINKMDLETANPERVKSDLTSYDVLTEDLGGDVLCAEVSAKEGTNIDDLLDKVMLQAELQDLRANPDREAHGAVVEARVERGLGTVATTLVQKGTIRVGDVFVAGETYGKVRALLGPDGKTRYDEVGPSFPVNVVGFEGVPSAGDLLVVVENEQDARELAENRQRISRERDAQSYQSGLMSSVAATFDGAMNKERREMFVLVKADVQGSAEALTRALSELKLENDEAVVTVKVLVSEAGEVTKSDIVIAGVTPGTTVLAFNVAASYDAMEDARANNIPIEYYSIIYDAIESVESRMQEVLSPTPEGEYVGKAVVQEVFNIGGTGNIAGSRCSDGFLRKGSNVRVMRGDKILGESRIKTLRNFKAEVDTIEEGNECGIGLVDFEEFQPDDVIECYVEKKK